MMSSIGAVMSRTSEEPYDPEQMLKSIVASRVQVARKPMSSVSTA